MNKHLHPFSVKARRLLHFQIQEWETERKEKIESWRRSEGKGWQMEGWINVEMNQQQSNKAVARFSGSSHNSSDLFPPWHNYHSCSNYFSLLNRFLMAACVLFLWSCLQSEGFESCCATLSPLTVSTDLHRKGEGGGEGGGEGLSLENGPGPRPALPWPSNCARILMTCVYSMWAQMADRFRGLLCFLLHCFLLVSRQLIIIIVSYYWKDNKSTHTNTRTHTNKCAHTLADEEVYCPHPHLHLQSWDAIWSLNTTRQMTTGHFTYSSIISHWFIPVYLFISWQKKKNLSPELFS